VGPKSEVSSPHPLHTPLASLPNILSDPILLSTKTMIYQYRLRKITLLINTSDCYRTDMILFNNYLLLKISIPCPAPLYALEHTQNKPKNSSNSKTIFWIHLKHRSWGSSVNIVSDYRLDDRGSIPCRGKRFLLQPVCPGQLWGRPSLLFNGYRGFFPQG